MLLVALFFILGLQLVQPYPLFQIVMPLMIEHNVAQTMCRVGCAACCIAPSISSVIPGMPNGKPAGVACIQLDPEGRCQLFGLPERPAVCLSLQPEPVMCGDDREYALHYLSKLENSTAV